MKKGLALVLILLFLSPLLVIQSNTAQAQGERVPTSCTIFVDNIVEGQPVTVTIQMSPATPTGEGYTQLTVYLISPQGVGASSPNGPWVYTNIPTDPNGRATVTFDVPTYSGNWFVDVFFGSHYYANYSMLYLAGNWRTGFTVFSDNTPTPSPMTTITPVPTQTTSPTPTPTPYLPPRNPPHLEPIDYLLPISVILIIVVVLSVLVLRRHRNVKGHRDM